MPIVLVLLLYSVTELPARASTRSERRMRVDFLDYAYDAANHRFHVPAD